MTPFAELFRRFRKDDRGVFLVIFAVLGLVLIATSGAVVDFTRIQQARTKAQNALDAATLALQSTIEDAGVTAETLKTQAQALLTERMADNTITATVTSAVPDKDNDKLTLYASLSVSTYFVQLVGVKTISAHLLSQVVASSKNLEVAIAADITYSMLGSRLDGLKAAMLETIKQLVKTDQNPTYSKLAIAPYSNGVNIGSYASAVRDPLTPGVAIKDVTGTVGSILTISSVTKSGLNDNPRKTIVTTSSAHLFTAGNYVYIGSVTGMTQLAEGIYRVGTVTNDGKSFELKKASDNTNYDSYTWSNYTANSGKVIKCVNATCDIVLTTNSNHGFANAEFVTVKSAGASYFNDKFIEVSAKTNTTFVPKGVTPLTANIMGTGGTVYCIKYGCMFYRFNNNNNPSTLTTFVPTECAVERTKETYAYLDTPPATDKVGIQYAPTNGVYYSSPLLEACPTSTIQPLTHDRDTLNGLVNGFVAQGSTAGHIGLAWAWYMLSPDFTENIASWPTDSRPAEYDDADTVKAIILMTDGEFNTMYEYGVPSKSADYVDNSKQSNKETYYSAGPPATYATSLSQADKLCTEIKKPKYNTLLYVIGFGITKNSAFDVALKKCATNEGMYKTASDAATLKEAFKQISQTLSELRISQ